MKKALITGITGQDGSYLAELLLGKNYEVYGLRRAASTFHTERIDHLIKFPNQQGGELNLIYGDVTDSSNLNRVLEKVMPDEIYHLAAQSHVHLSFQIPDYTAQIDALGTLRLLDAMKNIVPSAKFYQASTSELYGKVSEIPQTEKTPFYPRSPYGAAKLYAYWTTVNYREAYDMFACNGILFNHESPRRGRTFVTRKITHGVSRIKYGELDKLYLGNLDASRDWGYAGDYVEAMWLMLQHKIADDFVIASGKTHTVREFVERAFKYIDVEMVWKGEGVEEQGMDKKTGKVLVEVDPRYFRPTEVELLLGDPAKAKNELGWEPKTSLEELIDLMMASDLKEVSGVVSSTTPRVVVEKKKEDKPIYTEITKCRMCGNSNLKRVIDLDIQSLTGVFPKPDEYVPSGPLHLVKCVEDGGSCGLLQLGHNFDLDEMYGDNYGYRSGLNKSMVEHLEELVSDIEKKVSINPGDFVIDIGSNDSTLLQKYKESNLVFLGIDPTSEKFKEYYPPHINRVGDFFTADIVKKLYPDKKAKIVTSIAMFYDLPDPLKFTQDVADILDDEGIWVLEQSYMPHMLDNTSYDTVCHEHLEYYSLRDIKWLADKTGLKIIDVTFNDINGASFCVTLAKRNSSYVEAIRKVEEVINEEINKGLSSLEIYEEFANDTLKHKEDLVRLLDNLKRSGKRIVGYGASTKGNVVLQYCNIGTNYLDNIAEVNEYKFGRKTPGTMIPIVSEAESKKNNPDYMLVLPWHFRKGIVKRESEYLSKGGHLIFPLPRLEIV